MRINPDLGTGGAQGLDAVNTSTNTASQAAKPLQPAAQDTNDQAKLSSDAQQLSTLSGSLASVPQVRQDRVSALTQAVQSGTYSVSNQQIASSMLRDFRSTTSSTQG